MLSIGNLHEELLERQHRRNQVYEDILEKIISKIKYVNSISDDCYVVYKLNNFIYGVPMFNVNKCGNYLQKRLSDAGFYARYNQKHFIFISWISRPKQDKVLQTHNEYIPSIKSSTSEQNYLDYNNNQISYHTQYPNIPKKKEPNMLLLNKKQSPLQNKQLMFQEVDKMFLSDNKIIPDNTITNSTYNQYTTSKQNFNNSNNYNISQQQSNNIKSFNVDTNVKSLKINKNYNNRNSESIPSNTTSPSTSQSGNNLDDFLGTLL
jgi:hypothetical protein